MRYRRCEFAHSCEPGDTRELCLRDLQVTLARAKPILGLLSFTYIADEASRIPYARQFPPRLPLELLTILALSGNFDALPVKMPLSSSQILFEPSSCSFRIISGMSIVIG